MTFLTQAEQWLVGLAQHVPIEAFTFLGAMIEEIVAPIPSPLVMTMGGSIAQAQQKGLPFLLTLALIGAVGKTLGSWIVYVVADKAEDLVIGKWGKYLGISHKEIEKVGKYFNGGLRDDILLFLARALPIMPTAPVSIGCGVIKLKMRTYIVSTFFGTLVRNLFYLWVGYAGFAGAESLLSGLDSAEKIVQILLAALGLVLLGFIYYQRNKDGDILERIMKWFKLQ